MILSIELSGFSPAPAAPLWLKHMKLSVVIAAWNRPAALDQCLTSLAEQAGASDTEIIAVSNFDGAAIEAIKKRYPRVKYVSLQSGATVPELRGRGVACAQGEIVALLEDTCLVDERWLSEIKQAHLLPYVAVGGAIENASGASLLDWAVYFFDYGKYMAPNQAGVIDSLPGINVSYKRSVIELAENIFNAGFSETFIHEELKRQGQELYLSDTAVVYYKKNDSLKETLPKFYHLARSFGGKRVADATPIRQMVLTFGSLALPILLPARIALSVVRKGRNIRPLLLSLPYLILLMTGWAAGEFCGYVWGEGDSSGKWK
jgi:glycosyltransferase involved in cell wall biosynthesis